MAVVRIFTGEDGESHFEELDASSHPGLITPRQASTVVFKPIPAGYFNDWHPAPCRQYVITLRGEAEIVIGDGTIRRFRPGDGLLAEDVTGRGHTMRTIGDRPCLTVQVRL